MQMRSWAHALGLAPSRLKVIPNGVPDAWDLARPGDRARFIMVARTGFQKDHETALRAFAQLDGDKRFTCVGGGTDEAAFAARVCEWTGSSVDRITLLGPRPDVAEILAGHGVFVLSSRYEGMPLSVIEAMRTGLPVISTDVGASPSWWSMVGPVCLYRPRT